MLPFKNRLVKKKDFEKIQKIGQFFSQNNIAIKFISNGTAESRIGFSVGLRYSKLAIARNQAKRMLREIFRSYLKRIKKGIDMDVIIRKREGEKINNKKIEADINTVLKKAGLID